MSWDWTHPPEVWPQYYHASSDMESTGGGERGRKSRRPRKRGGGTSREIKREVDIPGRT